MSMPQYNEDDDFGTDATNKYFAAASTFEIAAALQDKLDDYYTYIVSSNLTELWRRSYRAYYGMRQNVTGAGWGVFETGALQAAGDQGEIIRVKVNQFSNLVTNQLSLTTANREALACRAVNSDAKSLVSAKLGDGLLDYYFRDIGLEQNYLTCVETAIVLSEGYMELSWDENSGPAYGVKTLPNGRKSKVYAGEISCNNFTPFQVVKDVTQNSSRSNDWYIVHDTRNRYDLMAQYPHLKREIAQVSADMTVGTYRTMGDPSKIIAATNFGINASDQIPYNKFYHRPTAAVPEGRFTIFIDGGIKLHDGPLPFEDIPVYRISPKNIISTPFGWSVAFDILALQELLDKLYTIVSSNVLGSGVQNFWSPPDNNLKVSDLGGNRSLIESFTKPEVLDLLRTPGEVYAYINKIESVMQTLVGLSSVNRGDLPSKDMSGTALAFLASQAITFTSGLQASAKSGLEDLGTGALNMLKSYVQTERNVIISGKQNRPQILKYFGKDLSGINDVVCDMTGALSKTASGKISIAHDLLTNGMVKSPQEYMTLINTGTLEPMTKSVESQNMLIQQENEWMMQGKLPRVLRIDQHAQHIEEHSTLLASPDARGNDEFCELVLSHIKEHEDMQLQMQINEPALLAATGQPPLPFPQQPVQPGQQPQQQNSNGAPPLSQTLAPPLAQDLKNLEPPAPPKLPRGTDSLTQQSYEQLLNQQEGQ